MAISNSSYVQNKYAAYENVDGSLNAKNSAADKSKDSDSQNKSNRIDSIKDAYTPSTAAKSFMKYGNTIGEPKLSEEAEKVYEELKRKYARLNFVLVGSSEKDGAMNKASRYANGYQITAVIDEEQLERMAADPEYRKQMESYIDDAIQKMDSMREELEQKGLSELVKGIGMQVNDDGTISYFAVLKDMARAQKEHIEEHLKNSREESKEASRRKAKEADDREKQRKATEEKTKEITANSIEEFWTKIEEALGKNNGQE